MTYLTKTPAFLLLAAFILPTPALAQYGTGSADLESSIVFLEYYVEGATGDKVTEYAKSVANEVVKRGKYSRISRSDVLTRIKAQLSAPASKVTEHKLIEIEKLVAKGDELRYTDLNKAVDTLYEARAKLKSIVDADPLDSRVRKEYFTVQMLLARSHQVNKNERRARKIMEEIVKTFEDEYTVDKKNFHPDLVKLYEETSIELKQQKTASLLVTSSPPGCDIYINGRKTKEVTPFKFENLYPGDTKVQVTSGNLQSMVHKVTLAPAKIEKTHIDLGYETALAFSGDKFGFSFSSPQAVDDNLVKYAAKFGKYLKVEYVALISVVQTKVCLKLSGHLVEVAGGKLVRKKAFVVKPSVVSKRRVSEMSAFIIGKRVASPDPVPLLAGPSPWYTSAWGWSLAGASIASLGTGLYFYFGAVSHKENAEISYVGVPPVEWPKLRDAADEEAAEASTNSTLSVVFGAVSGALAVGSIIAFILHDRSDSPQESAFRVLPMPVYGGGGVLTEWRF
jgi:hypothetical protein